MTVICISLLGGAYASLVKDLLCYPTCVHAWMLVSRLNSKRQPVVVLLPVDPVIEGIFLTLDRDGICKFMVSHTHTSTCMHNILNIL